MTNIQTVLTILLKKWEMMLQDNPRCSRCTYGPAALRDFKLLQAALDTPISNMPEGYGYDPTADDPKPPTS